jgi:hypothetical protein
VKAYKYVVLPTWLYCSETWATEARDTDRKTISREESKAALDYITLRIMLLGMNRKYDHYKIK